MSHHLSHFYYFCDKLPRKKRLLGEERLVVAHGLGWGITIHHGGGGGTAAGGSTVLAGV